MFVAVCVAFFGISQGLFQKYSLVTISAGEELLDERCK